MKVVDSEGEAFKLAAAHLNPQTEAAVLSALEHPNIVELIDTFEEDRWVFIVMERVAGGELFAAISDPSLRVTETSIGIVGRQLLQALNKLHENDVVHRDVKADNILLAENPAISGQWHIKLVDFGLATHVDPKPSSFLRIMCKEPSPHEVLICGTAYYCAPEVWINEYNPKVDIWAAGVVLYLALYGAFPFYHKDPNQLEAMICSRDSLPSFSPTCERECPDYRVSSQVQQCMELLLAKDQRSRPGAARALAQPWFNSPGVLQPQMLLPPQSFRIGTQALTARGERPIPAPVRAKAGRAARQPPVDPKKEQARSEDLQMLREQRGGPPPSKGQRTLHKRRRDPDQAWQEVELCGLSDGTIGVPALSCPAGGAAYQGQRGLQARPLLRHDRSLEPWSESEGEETVGVCGCG